MSTTSVVRCVIAVAAGVLAFDISTMAQHPTPRLREQPGSPLEIVSMQPVTTPALPNIPPHISETIVDYELVVRNKSSVPIMAYAIRHELSVGTKIAASCQASMFFSDPVIGAGATKSIQSRLQKGGPTITPVVDLVLLQNGEYYGADTCGMLRDYTTTLDDRRTMLQIVLRRLETDGIDKTTAWVKQELSVDVSGLRSPRKMK